jgi:hypothetical protein
VFGMATFAIRRLVFSQPSMKSGSVVDVLRYITVIVAGKTALDLISFFQSLMATFTLFLERLMPVDYRSGHQQQVKLAGLAVRQV